MVESVDTRDLKSLGHCGCAGSSPASSTGKRLCKSMVYGAFPFYMLDWTYPYYIQFMRFWGSQLNRKLNYELNPNAV